MCTWIYIYILMSIYIVMNFFYFSTHLMLVEVFVCHLKLKEVGQTKYTLHTHITYMYTLSEESNQRRGNKGGGKVESRNEAIVFVSIVSGDLSFVFFLFFLFGIKKKKFRLGFFSWEI